MGEWRYSFTFLDPRTRWWMVTFTPRPLYPQRTSTRYPLDRRLGGPHSRSGRCWVENSLLPAPWINPVTCRYTGSIPFLFTFNYTSVFTVYSLNHINILTDGCPFNSPSVLDAFCCVCFNFPVIVLRTGGLNTLEHDIRVFTASVCTAGSPLYSGHENRYCFPIYDSICSTKF
jgi:hypothetical protein